MNKLDIISYCKNNPGLEIQDLFKYVYQGIFGCSHFVGKNDTVSTIIDTEVPFSGKDSIKTIEKISNKYSRVHLKAIDEMYFTKDELTNMFILSSQIKEERLNALENTLEACLCLSKDKKIPFDYEILKDKIEKWKKDKYCPISHSNLFKDNYNPSYRVISNKYLKEIFNKDDISTAAELELTDIFSDKIALKENVLRFSDSYLKDMYDHNYYYIFDLITNDEINKLLKFSNSLKERHFKLVSPRKQPFLEHIEEMESSILLTMWLDYSNNFNHRINDAVSFKNIHKDDIGKDIMAIELKEYGEVYEFDFVQRKMNRYIEKAKEANSKLNFFCAYIENKPVGYLYTFNNERCVSFDGLIVLKEYRYKRIATSLIKYIYNYFKKPLFLHADYDDTPKNIYYKFGFRTIKTEYEYLLMKDNKDE